MLDIASKISIGTAQFGLNYGFTNKSGKVDLSVVEGILDYAQSNQVRKIDTAVAYGDAEKVLSNFDLSSFDVTTKLSPDFALDEVRKQVEQSLTFLKGAKSINFLFHRASDYSEAAVEVLQEYQRSEEIRNLGVSLYAKSEFEGIADKQWIDCVQAPYSLVDTRLDATYFPSFNSEISLQIRSLYLQGLLLQPVSALPDFVPVLKQQLTSLLKELNQEKLTPNQLIQFSIVNSRCEDVVLGFENVAQLQACFEESGALIPTALSIPEAEYLPTNWPK